MTQLAQPQAAAPALALEMEAEDLALALKRAIAPKTSPADILTHVRLQADGQALVVTSTDQRMEVSTRHAATVGEAGACLVPAAELRASLTGLRGPVSLAVEDGALLMTQPQAARVRRYRFDALAQDLLPVFDAREATEVPVDAPALAAALGRVEYAAAANDVRHYLNGVYLGHAVVATDGHRLAMVDMALPEALGEAIVPRPAIARLRRLLEGAEPGEATLRVYRTPASQDGSMAYASRALEVERDDETLITRLIDGRYPDAGRVIPAPVGDQVLLDADALSTVLGRLVALNAAAGRDTFGVRLVCRAGARELLLRTEGAEDYVPADVGVDREIGFAPRYLLDVAQRAIAAGNPTGAIAWHVGEASQPQRFELVGHERETHVVMPKRL